MHEQLKCQICGKVINSMAGLGRHILVHKNEINHQEYYNKYLKTDPQEGICPITNKPTRFKSLKDGYYKYCGRGSNSASDEVKIKKRKTIFKNYGVKSAIEINKQEKIEKHKKTRLKKRLIKKLHDDLELILNIKNIDKNNKKQCQICGRIFPNTHKLGLHLKIHKVKTKDYYDYFFKTPTEGICPYSKKETSFISLEDGYRKFKEKYQKDKNVVAKCKNTNAQHSLEKLKEKSGLYQVEIINKNQFLNIHSSLDLKCLKCGNIYKNRFYNLQLGYGKCPICYPRNTHISKWEVEVYEEIEKYFDEKIIASCCGIINSEKTNRPLELDIYIPSKKIAIECNGLYWHSELILDDPINYHLNKLNLCKEQNIQLIHIFEDEWLSKKEILKKMILHKLGINNNYKIYARKCNIKEIDPKTKNKFLDNNHIQGRDASKVKLGLFFDDKLIAVMTFSGKNLAKGTYNIDDNTWELSRFATDINYQVIGGAGKLLKYFQRNYEWSKIFTYADLRYSNGNMYNQLGFKLISQSRPNYWYVDGLRRIYRFNLRKKPDEPKDISEHILRKNEGYYRIWDCGNLKFEINRTK